MNPECYSPAEGCLPCADFHPTAPVRGFQSNCPRYSIAAEYDQFPLLPKAGQNQAACRCKAISPAAADTGTAGHPVSFYPCSFSVLPSTLTALSPLSYLPPTLYTSAPLGSDVTACAVSFHPAFLRACFPDKWRADGSPDAQSVPSQCALPSKFRVSVPEKPAISGSRRIRFPLSVRPVPSAALLQSSLENGTADYSAPA